AVLHSCAGGDCGAYSQSVGLEIIRKHVADFISKRDGFPCDYENVILSNGASEAIRNVLKMFIRHDTDKKTGVMVPIPQYPLYSATIEEFGLGEVGYYLDEEKNWALLEEELERAYNEGLKNCDTKVMVVINPGNPTGQVLSHENIETIIKFAHRHKLFLMADEVYQVSGTSSEIKEQKLPLGFMGECGMRGGYVELFNIDPEVFMLFKKMISAKLCAGILGQVIVDALVNPPKPGDPSYNLWMKERTEILQSFKERAKLVKEAYASMKGISCNEVQGALYAFPKVKLPKRAIDEARLLNQEPDFFYAMQLLEATGVCVIPGSGFGQKEGTYHFR
ncbi:unnamed protein product, partial [Heligmosomoides polygyrus]|uniref:alanine transaminase n=1 Tax=Heligmosomoides polygyrus TaxID=6339 RepID=A0A183GFR1_HELPZ